MVTRQIAWLVDMPARIVERCMRGISLDVREIILEIMIQEVDTHGESRVADRMFGRPINPERLELHKKVQAQRQQEQPPRREQYPQSGEGWNLILEGDQK